MEQDQLVDYTIGNFNVPFTFKEKKYYASVHPEMYGFREGDLNDTGCFCVYLLHPCYGSMYFKLEPEDGKWVLEEKDSVIADEIIELIGNAINERKILSM